MPTPTLRSTSRHTPSNERNWMRSRSERPARAALSARKRCSALARSSPTKSWSSTSAKPICGALRERMIARDHQHEAVAAVRIGLEPPGIDRAGDDADVGDAFGDQPDDLVGEPLLQIDADVRMRGEERAQRLGQELGQRIGVREHAHLAGEPARIGAEVLAQPLGLRQHGARMLQQRAAGLRRRHALPAARQQRRAERLLPCGGCACWLRRARDARVPRRG